MAHIPDVVIVPAAQPIATRKKKANKAFTPRLRVTLQVSNEFEGAIQVYVHEADTISTLLAEQEAVKVARKKYRMAKSSRSNPSVDHAVQHKDVRNTLASSLT